MYAIWTRGTKNVKNCYEMFYEHTDMEDSWVRKVENHKNELMSVCTQQFMLGGIVNGLLRTSHCHTERTFQAKG
jgi:hypothetical protein